MLSHVSTNYSCVCSFNIYIHTKLQTHTAALEKENANVARRKTASFIALQERTATRRTVKVKERKKEVRAPALETRCVCV